MKGFITKDAFTSNGSVKEKLQQTYKSNQLVPSHNLYFETARNVVTFVTTAVKQW